MDLPAECVGRLPPPDLPLLVPQDLLVLQDLLAELAEAPFLPDLPLLVPHGLLAELAEAPFLPESLHRFLPPAVERLSLPEPPSPPDLPLLAQPAYMLRIFVCISVSALAKLSGGNHPYAGK